ncbi:MAG: coproporphyrinogen III oxidase family protein [Lachnospiraceae bacterium]|nr:coproporphyrinogen III oxidase family protein [Lachnospiraceae bacterium]
MENNEIQITIYRLDNNDITINIILPEESVTTAKDGTSGVAGDGERHSIEERGRVNSSTDGSEASASTEKNLLKQMLYRALSETTGRTLPWGALTGIRPTKIASQMLSDSKDDNTIINYLKTVHYVSEDRARLSLEIAHREREILSRHDYASGYSLYVGIPFCPTRCAYCSFAAYPLRDDTGRASFGRQASFIENRRAECRDVKDTTAGAVDAYLDALEKELRATALLMAGTRLDTLYIGGGTPTALSATQLARLMTFLQRTFDLTYLKEYTVEAGRPDSILDDPEKLHVIKALGADRICVNPQTFTQRTLDLIGRHHTTEQTIRAYRAAREAGFDNINMDIILGLPGETTEDVRHTMDVIEDLAPDDLTLHSLAIKRGSRMHADMQGASGITEVGHQGVSPCTRPPRKADTCDLQSTVGAAYCDYEACAHLVTERALAMGLSPYYLYRQKNMTGNGENTGFARPGKEGITNILGMEEVHSIVACGAGAITKRVFRAPEGDARHGLIRRCANVKELQAYLTRIDEMIARKEKLFS